MTKRGYKRAKVTNKETVYVPILKPQFTLPQKFLIFLRHLLPVFGTIYYGWSLSQFAFLSAFNVSFSMGAIAVIGIGVSMLKDGNAADKQFSARVQEWLTLIVAAAFIVGLLTIMFGWVIIVMAPEGISLLAHRGLWVNILLTAVAAAPAVYNQMQADLASGVSEEQRKLRDQPRAGVLFFSGIVIFAFASYAADWFGSDGLYPLMFALTAFFIFSDLRPDVLQHAIKPTPNP